MSQGFNPKSFIRLAPNHLLREHFTGYQIAGNIHWDFPNYRDEVYETIEKKIPASLWHNIQWDFSVIYHMGDELGNHALYDEASYADPPEPELLSKLQAIEGGLERSYVMYLHHRDIFDAAFKLHRLDSVKPFIPVGRLKIAPIITDETSELLGKRAAIFFQDKEGKGHGSCVDTFSRRGCLSWAVKLEGYTQQLELFTDDHKLTQQRLRLPYEIAFEYQCRNRTLRIAAKGGKEIREKLAEIFAQTVMGLRRLPVEFDGCRYDLTPFGTREYSLPAADGVRYSELRRLDVRIPGKRVRPSCPAPRNCNHEIYEWLEITASGYKKSPDMLVIACAEIDFVFETCSLGEEPVERITIRPPNYCSLNRGRIKSTGSLYARLPPALHICQEIMNALV